MTTEWKETTKEELEKAKAQRQAMEFFANLGGRTLGLSDDEKIKPVSGGKNNDSTRL